jgi:8-oxo-dGTP diphosphatase
MAAWNYPMNEANFGTGALAVPRAAVSAAIFLGSDVLLVQRGQPPAAGLWSLPGGHIEPGETAQDAIIRELGEETGVTAHFQGVSDVVDVIRRDSGGRVRFHRVIVVFCGVWLGGEAAAGSDAASADWYARDGLSALSTTSGLDRAVTKAWAMVDFAQKFHQKAEFPEFDRHGK